jgi:hypothetical protein
MALTKFCEKSSTHTQASGDILREENSSLLSPAPLTTAEEYCAVAALESNMKKKEDARLAVLREYDRWAKDHPKDATKMGGYVFFGYLEKGQTFSISVPSAANGKPFMAGFVTEVD